MEMKTKPFIDKQTNPINKIKIKRESLVTYFNYIKKYCDEAKHIITNYKAKVQNPSYNVKA